MLRSPVRSGLAGVLACVGLACTPNKASPDSPDPTGSAAASSSTSATIPPVSASSTSPIPAIEKWSGTYSSAAGSLYVFDGGEWAGVQWRGDDAGAGLGEGTVTLSVDRKTGLVQGVAGGAIGDATLSGTTSGDMITASVARKDPLDRGFTGTAVAKATGDKMVGTMRLSVANARLIREASLTLSREKP